MLYCRESETVFFSLRHTVMRLRLFSFFKILYCRESETVSTDAILSFGPVPLSDCVLRLGRVTVLCARDWPCRLLLEVVCGRDQGSPSPCNAFKSFGGWGCPCSVVSLGGSWNLYLASHSEHRAVLVTGRFVF